MNESDYQHLIEISWRRPLNPAEEARLQSYLALHPEAQADWESEAGLSQLMGRLYRPPLPSNFTAQVLQTLEREEAAVSRRVPLGGRLERLIRRAIPRLAWASVLMALAFLGYHQYQVYTQDEMARDLLRFSQAANLNDPAVFKDLEAIRRLGQMPPPTDEDLWLALAQPSR